MEKILQDFSVLTYDQRLARLGLKKEWLLKVSETLALIPNEITSDDIAGALGLKAYIQAVRTLREVLKPYGWQPYRDRQLELVISPKKDFYIAVSSGDQFTGIKNIAPKTRYPKGPQTLQRVDVNKQLNLFPELKKEKEKNVPLPTWYFLYFIDLKGKEVRSELSYPLDTDEQGRISSWKTRIILPSIKIESEVKIDLEAVEAEGVEEIILGEQDI